MEGHHCLQVQRGLSVPSTSKRLCFEGCFPKIPLLGASRGSPILIPLLSLLPACPLWPDLQSHGPLICFLPSYSSPQFSVGSPGKCRDSGNSATRSSRLPGEPVVGQSTSQWVPAGPTSPTTGSHFLGSPRDQRKSRDKAVPRPCLMLSLSEDTP